MGAGNSLRDTMEGGDTDGWADGRAKSESQETEAVENWSLREQTFASPVGTGWRWPSKQQSLLRQEAQAFQGLSPSSLLPFLGGRDGHPTTIRGEGAWCCLDSKAGRSPRVQGGTPCSSRGPWRQAWIVLTTNITVALCGQGRVRLRAESGSGHLDVTA